MLMTRASRLPIEVLVELADSGSEGWTTAADLSRRTTGELPFVQQLLNRLARQGIVRSKQGRGGGYQLARNPKALTLKSVSEAVDGLGVTRRLFDSTVCDGRKGRRLAPTWHSMREGLIALLDTETTAVSRSAAVGGWIGSSYQIWMTEATLGPIPLRLRDDPGAARPTKRASTR